MNRPAAEPAAAPAHTDAAVGSNRHRRRARFEVIFASIWLAVGLFVVPATIFAVGGALLGPYGDNGGLGRFYGDFFGDLIKPSMRAWAIALAPLALISLLRLVFVGTRGVPTHVDSDPDHPAAARRTAEEARRVEPRISTD